MQTMPFAVSLPGRRQDEKSAGAGDSLSLACARSSSQAFAQPSLQRGIKRLHHGAAYFESVG